MRSSQVCPASHHLRATLETRLGKFSDHPETSGLQKTFHRHTATDTAVDGKMALKTLVYNDISDIIDIGSINSNASDTAVVHATGRDDRLNFQSDGAI